MKSKLLIHPYLHYTYYTNNNVALYLSLLFQLKTVINHANSCTSCHLSYSKWSFISGNMMLTSQILKKLSKVH